jgi:DNA-binding MarR family transcriptional regulator
MCIHWLTMYPHATSLPVNTVAGNMWAMTRRGAIRTGGQAPERLSPCVCSTLRMVTRAVTQLYDDILRPSGLRVTQFSILSTIARLGEANLRQLEDTLAIDQTTLTRSLNLLGRDGVIERVPHPDGRIKAMRPTAKGRRVLDVARPLWVQAQGLVLRELGTNAWADAKRRLAHVLDVAVENRGRRRAPPSRAPRRTSRMTPAGG